MSFYSSNFLQSNSGKCKKPKKSKPKKKAAYKPPATPLECSRPTYEPCVHLHFKSEAVDRECLTHDQYLDMLATPKGYPWLGEADCYSPDLERNKPMKKKKGRKWTETPQVVRPDGGDFAEDFVEDMWDVMSPEVTNRLVDFLVNEFGMSFEEAEDFIDCKAANGTKNACRKKKSKPKIGLGPKHKWVKEFSDVFAKRIEQYIVSMLMTKRTPRVKLISEKILASLCDLTGEKTTLQNPKTKVQKTMVLISDRLALWVEDLISDLDKPSKRATITESEEEEEGEENEKEEPEQKEEETAAEEEEKPKEDEAEPAYEEETPSEEEEKSTGKEENPEGEEEKQAKEEEPEEERLEENEEKPAEKEETPAKEEKTAQEEVTPIKEEVTPMNKEEKPDQEEERTEQEEAKRIMDEEKPVVKEEPTEKPEEKEEEGVEEEEKQVGEEEKPAEESPEEEEKTEQEPEQAAAEPTIAVGSEEETTAEEETVIEEPITEEEQPEELEKKAEEGAPETTEEESIVEEEEKQSQPIEEPQPFEVRESKITDGAESEPTAEKEYVQEKKVYDDIFDIVKEDIARTQKTGPTERQKAVKGVVDRRLEKILAGKETELAPEDIDDAASRVAHWVEKLMSTPEPMREVKRRGPGGAFQVRPKTGSVLQVQKLSSGTVAEQTAKSRGIEAPTRGRKVPGTQSPVNLDTARDFVDWVSNAATLTDEWGAWLESKLTDAEKQVDSKQNDWKERKDLAQNEALKWRVEKARIGDEGRVWGKKLEEKEEEREVRVEDL